MNYESSAQEVPFSEAVAEGRQNQSSMAEYINGLGITEQNSRAGESLETDSERPILGFSELLASLLSPEQLQTAELRMADKGMKEIVGELGLSERAVINRLSRARETLDDKIFYPLGLRRIADYHDNVLTTAAGRGSLQAIKFLGLWYTSDQWIRSYQPRRMSVMQAVVDEGYLLLSESTTTDEYATLRGKRYAHLLRKDTGRIYIIRKNLEAFRNQRRRNVRAEPPEGLQPLRNFAANIGEYLQLHIAAVNGELEAVKEGNWWFARPEDAASFLSNRPPTQPAKRKPAETGLARENVLYDESRLRNLPEGDFPAAFTEWFFTNAKVVSDQRLPWRKRRDLPQPYDLQAAYFIVTQQLEQWIETRGIRMYPSHLHVVDLKFQGKNSGDIAREIGWSEGSVNTTLSAARKSIEDGLIYPAQISRVSSYRDKSLDAAAVAGRLDAVWFLGRWYTTDNRIALYRPGTR